MPPRKTNVLAVVAFVLGLIAFVPLCVILGIVALVQISKSHDKGKGFAIAGFVVSGVWIVGIIAVAVIAGPSEPARDASGQVTTTQDTRPDKLRVGDCVTGVKEGEVQNIKIQPCNQPNGGKVYAVFDLPKGKWPGLTAVQAAAEKGCTDRYRSSNEQADSPSDIFYLHPTQDSWTLGDRGTTCLLTPR
jgi:hypothetical protein